MFHDTTDGASFSAFVAQELLAAFIVQHGDELGNMGHNLRDFHRFQYRILSVIRESVKPIVRKCKCWLRADVDGLGCSDVNLIELLCVDGGAVQKQRGILKAMLVVDGAVTCATGDVDPIGVLANLQALVNSSIDMSTLAVYVVVSTLSRLRFAASLTLVNARATSVSFSGDGVSSMTIQSGRNSCIQVSVVEGNDALVVVYKKGAQASKNTAAIEECVRALRHGTYTYTFQSLLCSLGSLDGDGP
ncbi:unnamed protein product [Phytophthora fragariaefolia]|uniref:Unnamed protein product n=1 Tax=Phytophthora fragariaefolia TaxID=1490495 RepID=A0A9W6U184_9STRA|nr:unnamed protein product [Phytophthora fragariaefolia]